MSLVNIINMQKLTTSSSMIPPYLHTHSDLLQELLCPRLPQCLARLEIQKTYVLAMPLVPHGNPPSPFLIHKRLPLITRIIIMLNAFSPEMSPWPMSEIHQIFQRSHLLNF